mmetsp:Transcript_21159/g.58319  ORF Transcript_21159/g.58319 Transcript_21159/m.58319 type:complete len:204 (-) Transcript_21159:2404-3015(-)
MHHCCQGRPRSVGCEPVPDREILRSRRMASRQLCHFPIHNWKSMRCSLVSSPSCIDAVSGIDRGQAGRPGDDAAHHDLRPVVACLQPSIQLLARWSIIGRRCAQRHHHDFRSALQDRGLHAQSLLEYAGANNARAERRTSTLLAPWAYYPHSRRSQNHCPERSQNIHPRRGHLPLSHQGGPAENTAPRGTVGDGVESADGRAL